MDKMCSVPPLKGKTSCIDVVQMVIGVSLSEPHTSVTAVAEVVCMYVCGHIP